MPESQKIGGEPTPSTPPQPSTQPPPGPPTPRRRNPPRGPRKLGQAVGVKEIILFALAFLAILYIYLGVTRHWF